MKTSPVKCDFILPTPVGSLGLQLNGRGISCLTYISSRQKPNVPRSGIAAEVYQQLMEYFNSGRTRFDVPLDVQGTEFQRSVWKELRKIAYGKSMTYGDIANKLQSGARAVGNACRSNPVSIIIPCHRVVSKGGIGGYSGRVVGNPIARKRWLLQHEGAR